MSQELDTPWCPCQEARFEAQYPNVPREDMAYVDGVDYLERVHTKHYYKRKRQENNDPNDLWSGQHPQAPTTRRGTKIIDANFPDADFVCPCCEQGYVEEVAIRPVEEDENT